MIVGGVDLAFRSNSSALAIAHDRARPSLTVTSVREWKPTGRPMVPSIVCGEIAAECQAAGVQIVAADGHYAESLRESLDRRGIALVDAPARPSDAWLPTQRGFLEDRLRIVAHDRLRAQLEAARFSYESGGLVKVHQDTATDGSHGDLASAMVLAVWLLIDGADVGRLASGSAARGGFARVSRRDRMRANY